MYYFPRTNVENQLVDKKNRFDTTYTIKKLLGSGSYGSVYSAICIKDNREYAIKRIDMAYLKRRDEYRRQVHELNILFFNRSPYLLHAVDLEYRKEHCRLDIITELFVGGNLDDFIRKYRISGKTIPDHIIWTIFLQCCQGIKYLHLNGIIHRDIKPHNILLNHRDIPTHVVICDFGASICLTDQDSFCSTKIGTPCFMSPEQTTQPKYNKKTDIWSLGCILYEMITLDKPFIAPNICMLNFKISSGKFKPIGCRDNPNFEVWSDIINRMLDKNPYDRPAITSIIEMPAVRKKIFESAIKTDRHQPLIIPAQLINRIIPNSASFLNYTVNLYNEITITTKISDDLRIEYRPSPIKTFDGRPYSDSRILPKIMKEIQPENLDNIKKPFPLRLRDRVSAFRDYNP